MSRQEPRRSKRKHGSRRKYNQRGTRSSRRRAKDDDDPRENVNRKKVGVLFPHSIVVGGRILVDVGCVQEPHRDLVSRILDIVLKFDGDDNACVLKSVDVTAIPIECATVAFYHRYSIRATWEGSKELNSDETQLLDDVIPSEVSVASESIEWIMQSIVPSVSTLLANAERLKNMGVVGEDTEHRAQLLGLRTELTVTLTLNETVVGPPERSEEEEEEEEEINPSDAKKRRRNVEEEEEEEQEGLSWSLGKAYTTLKAQLMSW